MTDEIAIQLSVRGVFVLLKNQIDLLIGKGFFVKISVASATRKIGVCPDGLREQNQPLLRADGCGIGGYRNLRGDQERSFDLQLFETPAYASHVKFGQQIPIPLIERFELSEKFCEKRCFAVAGPQGLQMFVTPVNIVIDAYPGYRLAKIVNYGDGDPLPTGRRLDAVTILPFVFLELDIIQKNKGIRLENFGKISQPGEGLRLMNTADHKITLTMDFRWPIFSFNKTIILWDSGGFMNTIIRGCVVLAVISLILGVVSRLTMQPLFVEAHAYLEFAQFCFLAAITFLLYKMAFKIEE